MAPRLALTCLGLPCQPWRRGTQAAAAACTADRRTGTQSKTLLGPAFAPTMLHDRQQQPSVRQECFTNAKERPRELGSSIQSLHITAKSMQEALHQLCMLLLRPKVRAPVDCLLDCLQQPPLPSLQHGACSHQQALGDAGWPLCRSGSLLLPWHAGAAHTKCRTHAWPCRPRESP